jgi:FkbM family methyltransferase
MINRLLRLVRPLLANFTYTVRGGLAKGLQRQGGLGFLPSVNPPNAEEEYFVRRSFAGLAVYDVGAWEGVFTMFFARAVDGTGSVHTFEPNPANVEKIEKNISLNGFNNVTVHRLAVGAAKGEVFFQFDPVDTAHGHVANSSGDEPTVQSKAYRTTKVAIDTIDDQRREKHLPLPNFIKIDVEGAEYDVLRGMQETMRLSKPELFIEVHGDDAQAKIANVNRLITLLTVCGYSVRHIETGVEVTTKSYAFAAEGHLICTYAIHGSR